MAKIDVFVKSQNLAQRRKARKVNLLILKDIFLSRCTLLGSFMLLNVEARTTYILWELGDYHKARQFLETWCKDARNSAIKHLIKVANTLAAFRTAVLNYFKYHITSAVTKGIVNKIKTYQLNI